MSFIHNGKVTAVEDLIEENSRLRHRIKVIEEFLTASRHGRPKAYFEKQCAQQSFFNEAEEVSNISMDGSMENNQTISMLEHAREQKMLKLTSDNIERIDIVYDLLEADRLCPNDGLILELTNEDTFEQLDVVPGQIRVLRHICKTYECLSCNGPAITAQKPKQPIEKSIASAGLLAHIAVNKYSDGLPLFRQTTMLSYLGLDLDRRSVANWIIKCGELIQPLLNCLRDHLLKQSIVCMAEAPVQVLNKLGEGLQGQARMQVMATQAESPRVVLYDYEIGHHQDIPDILLGGYQGALIMGGGRDYYLGFMGEKITCLGCWAHVRRKCIDAQMTQGNGTDERINYVLENIKNLYGIEKEIATLPYDKRRDYRQEKAKPIIETCYEWIVKIFPQVSLDSVVGQTLEYLHNQWPDLARYLDNGEFPIDNGWAEEMVRPFALGQKNWLFASGESGAKASANLYSLIETAKGNGLNPYEYLKRVFKDLPNAQCTEDVENLLPWNVKNL